MAFFALLWKARTIENYRLNYEKEKINSIVLGNAQLEQTLSQRWRHYRFDTKKRISRIFKKWYPEGNAVSNFVLYLMTDQTFPNFLLKSVMGFVGGIILTYLCFMFFVFQLAISLIHATIMSSIIGVLLTLGLAFSYRIRCLVFLLIPQFFSRVGRYTLTCYALVLILTGPATNTLKNSEVLSESMACSQEQIKTSVHQLNDLMKKPIIAMKDSLKLMVDQLKVITAKVKETVIRLDRLVLSIVNTMQSSFSWLQSVTDICNAQLGTPYDRCCNAIQDGFSQCQEKLGPKGSVLCNVAYVAQAACYSVKPFRAFCYATDFMDEAISASVKKKLRNFTEHLRAMFHVEVHFHHSYSYSSNTSRSASQVAAGIVTEIRNRADPLLTWLSWSSCVTSLFLLLIIFRAKYYQHMYETRSRFDNRYITKELHELDLQRQQQGRETVLPLNRRERAKYITTSSFRLVASEKVYLNRSAVFMAITTFKLLIHMVADYSLYWVLITIRYHGRFQSDMMPGIPYSGAQVSGSGFVAGLFSAIVGILDIPLSFPAPSPISCLPDPYPPDLRRYTQIGVLIFLLWFFALFEPYGLRLRHLIMGHYRPERAKARATWLYNHILRTRGSFMKFARRKLHREYKYSSEASLTFRQWICDHVPCLTPGCPGVFCISCFTDIGELCTICLSPADYGDLSDVSLEKGSSDDSDSDAGLSEVRMNEDITLHSTTESDRTIYSTGSKDENRRWSFFNKTTGPRGPLDTLALLHTGTYKNNQTFFTTFFQNRFRKMKWNMKKRCRVKNHTVHWVAKLTSEKFKNFSKEKNHNYYSNCHDIEEYGEFDEVIHRRKSIGVNTDRNRGVLLNRLVNSFTRRRFKQSRTKKKKAKPELKLYEKPKKEHTNAESSKKSLSSTKTFHAHYLTIRQRNLKNIIKSKKDNRTKDKKKGYEELKGILKAIKHFLKSNDVKETSNQNNDSAPKKSIENSKKIMKLPNNANFGEKKQKKKITKGNKPKRPRKQKDVHKIKTKHSRHRIAEFHKFFSNHWNNFKCSIMPGNAQNRSDIPIPKEKRNHKRRKKRKVGVDLNETDIDEFFAKKDIKHTRNLRISAFLAELEWTKRDYRKEKDIDQGNDSLLHTNRAPVGGKIVGMVQLKNLPFQWRETPETEYYNCKEKKKLCSKKQSSTRLFVTLSKQKLYAKKALEKFRNKVNTVPESPSSSCVKRMASTVSAMRGDSTFNRESSICISKRPSVYGTFNQGLNRYSNILDTDMLFKNAKYGDTMQVPSEEIQSHLKEISDIDITSFLGNEIVVSCSSIKKTKNKRCRCDLYDDLQRKWDHLKKSFSDLPGPRNPFSMLKNFCSSLFGPPCSVDTCPNIRERKDRDKAEKKGIKKSRKSIKRPKMKSKESSIHPPITKRGEIHTQTQQHTETPLSDKSEIMETVQDAKCTQENAKLEECLRKRGKCVQEKAKLEECLRKQEVRMQQEVKGKYVHKGIQIVVKPEMFSRPCQAIDCPNYCHREVQYEEQDATGPKTSDPKTSDPKTSDPNSSEAIKSDPKTSDPKKSDPKKSDPKKSDPKTSDPKTKEINEAVGSFLCPCEHKGNQVLVKPEMASRLCQVSDCASLRHREGQYKKQDATDPRTNKENEAAKPIKSYMCLCDEALQMVPHHICTCATQHSGIKISNTRRIQMNSMMVNEMNSILVNEMTPGIPVVNKKTQRTGIEVAHKSTHCSTGRKHYKKGKDVKSGSSMVNHKLSLESSLLFDRGKNVAKALKEELTDYTLTDTSNSSISLRSDESKTDTTICSFATINYTPPRRKHRIKVVTKQNQSTLTDQARVRDTGTITHDWWSPLVERKTNNSILLEKKRAFNFIEKQKELRELKEWRELKDVRKRRRNSGMMVDGTRNVTFRSRTQIIPTALFPGANDVMSPSRYLLESQKYYNELFAYNYRPRPQTYNYVTQIPRYHEKEKTRSLVGSRRNHHRKAKRLDECYSPKKLSPRKRRTESTRTSDSPRRKTSYRHDRLSNNRHHAKNSSLIKRV